MKKLGLCVAVLMVVAAPALATVNITCTADGNVVTVHYSVLSEPNKVRAFALDITVDSPAEISTIDYNDPNYWVYPGSIDIVNGEVNDVGSPVASPTFPGTLGGLDTNGVTIEMGSLYSPTGDTSPSAPNWSGKLLKFTVRHVFEGCKVKIRENVIRGGVVLTNVSNPSVSIPSPAYTFVLLQIPPVPCPIAYPTSDCDGSYTVSWTASSGATSYQVERSSDGGSTWPTQVYDGPLTSYPESGLGNGSYRYRAKATNGAGSSAWCTGTWDCVVTLIPAAPATLTVPATDADGVYTVSWTASSGATSYQLESSAPASGTTIYLLWVQVYSGTALSYNERVGGGTWNYRVKATNACGSSGWTTVNGCIVADCLKNPGGSDPNYTAWKAWRYPACWCYQYQCRGDANGKKTGLYRVQLLDLQLLAPAYIKTDAVLAAIPNGICADNNHKKTGLYRVQLLDLQELAKYYIKTDASVPTCNIAYHNYWTTPP